MKRQTFVELMVTGVLALGLQPLTYAFQNLKDTNHDICKKVWDALCGDIGETYKTDAFNYVAPVKGKPNVLIYGDSISIMYSSTVMKILAGKANVIRLFKNGGSSKHFIPNMDRMNQTMFQPNLEAGWNFKWDVIHFNVGLHDLKYLKGKHLNLNGEQVSSISDYKLQLDAICTYLRTNHPQATLIFATTTSVPKGAKGRKEGDSVVYNKAALEVLSQYPVIEINDLYTFTKPHQKDWAQAAGNVHYNSLGSEEQGKAVARVISEYL
ncbi:GDSL-like lipase/acylhydrolase family protein [Formosa agariphila KMM 3901]|uniref:GDSL-like lipase/acylhydrolase family protein n=1 Tax=Formosa agariphila (strain DSM 15362 / KCTC 12365 / LMG 23005 / KMM 3901 / M-2Alg 35-1) TaxID=1347342 RepID=T2KL74_FORAG|nr:SGNH/GDSL hydrolase family protein [Formosa agariphila]CDF78744.1 GDSL-like lipase/acylhydrolase family protein [Formosa agariphila KMM 3901]